MKEADRIADSLEAILESAHHAIDKGHLATAGCDLKAAQEELARLRKKCGLQDPRKARRLAEALMPRIGAPTERKDL